MDQNYEACINRPKVWFHDSQAWIGCGSRIDSDGLRLAWPPSSGLATAASLQGFLCLRVYLT